MIQNQTAEVLVREDQSRARTTLARQEGSSRTHMKARRDRRAGFVPSFSLLGTGKQPWGATPQARGTTNTCHTSLCLVTKGDTFH